MQEIIRAEGDFARLDSLFEIIYLSEGSKYAAALWIN
jgi:hypothetical protein